MLEFDMDVPRITRIKPSRYPSIVELAFGGRAIPQLKVDKALIRDIGLLCHFFEVFNHIRAHPEGNLFFSLMI
jgi:hypothetical protein